MENIVLIHKEIFPSDEILKDAMGDSYEAYKELCDKLLEINVIPEWQFYNDFKSWLCKLPFKRKNLGWICAYKGCFTLTCYYQEKHLEQIEGSNISEDTKEKFYSSKPWGKLIPMIIKIDSCELPDDAMAMLLLKKELK